MYTLHYDVYIADKISSSAYNFFLNIHYIIEDRQKMNY